MSITTRVISVKPALFAEFKKIHNAINAVSNIKISQQETFQILVKKALNTDWTKDDIRSLI